MDVKKAVDGLGKWASRVEETTGLPANLLTAGVILVVGWLAALLLARLVDGLLRRFLRLVSGARRSGALGEDEVQRTRSVVERLVFWLVFTLAVMTATEYAGMPVVTAWLSGVASYLPRIVVAVLIAAAGLAIARVAGAAATRAGSASGFADARRLGRLAELSVQVLTALIAIEALGINVTFLQIALLVVLASLLSGAALAFGLGARELVADILACHYVRQLYQVGQRVRIDSAGAEPAEGRILRVVPPWIVVETPAGELAVPARSLTSGRSTLVTRMDS